MFLFILIPNEDKVKLKEFEVFLVILAVEKLQDSPAVQSSSCLTFKYMGIFFFVSVKKKTLMFFAKAMEAKIKLFRVKESVNQCSELKTKI